MIDKPLLRERAAQFRLPYEYFVYYGGLTLFGLMSLVWSLVAFPLGLILPRRMGAQLGRRTISFGFRSYLRVLEWSGIVECDLDALDSLRGEHSLVIAPNHPSLIDVVLVVSRLPNIACIMKANLWDQIILGGSARLAGYIRNHSQTNMIIDAADELHRGSQILVFPEGTRTRDNVLQPFKGGFALIAKRANVPVQMVILEINHPFLCKGCNLLTKPKFPLVFRARLGERFDPPGDVRPYIQELEQYCRDQLGRQRGA